MNRTEQEKLEENNKSIYVPYTLEQAYYGFGYRTYINIVSRSDNTKFIIYGIIISSGHIKFRIQKTMESDECVYISPEHLLKEYMWEDGSPCGIKVNTWIY